MFLSISLSPIFNKNNIIKMGENKKLASSFYVLVSVFFFWGFVAASNTILIGLFKEKFQLNQFQSQWVDSAFYLAYGIGSLIYFLISAYVGDPLNKIGYKKGLIIGLCTSAVGALGFVPAASLSSYPLMLGSLFIVAFGFAIQQIVANPYVIALGPPETGAHRVSLAGGINSFGTTIGPLLIAYALFGGINSQNNNAIDINFVKTPYTILAFAFIAFAMLLGISKLPPVTNTEKIEKDFGAFKYPQLILGMIAIFIYVGVEVATQSNLQALIKDPDFLGLDNSQSVHFISLYWGCLMVGRWVGALTVFNLNKTQKNILTVVVPFLVYGLIMLVNFIKGSPMTDFLYFIPFLIILIIGFFLAEEKPAKTMMMFGSMALALMVVGLMLKGSIAVYCFISGGLFCSVMWPCIFSLSIAGLGKYTNQGSALLIMMIFGGAIIPPLQGYVSDIIGLHMSYIIPALCFAYLAYYGYAVKNVLAKQGIDYESSAANAH